MPSRPVAAATGLAAAACNFGPSHASLGMRFLAPLGALARSVLDVVAPPGCLACGSSDAPGVADDLADVVGPADDAAELALCARCAALVPPLWTGACPRCAGRLGPGADAAACADCERLRPRFSAAVAAAPYAGFVGELVRRTKYGADPLLAVPLAALLRRSLRGAAAARDIDVVVPVPPHAGRSAERGFHLADLLADAAADAVRARARDDWLVRVGDPVPQASLPRGERLRAARGTVALRRPRLPWASGPDPAGRRVLVVDDVLTTGATADACARTLLAAGAAAVNVAVVARA